MEVHGDMALTEETTGSLPVDNNTKNSSVEDCKIKNFCKAIFSANGFKIFAGLVGTAAIIVGSLAAKGIVVLGTAAASLLAAKIMIPVGCVILVVLLAKMFFDCVKGLMNNNSFSSN